MVNLSFFLSTCSKDQIDFIQFSSSRKYNYCLSHTRVRTGWQFDIAPMPSQSQTVHWPNYKINIYAYNLKMWYWNPQQNCTINDYYCSCWMLKGLFMNQGESEDRREYHREMQESETEETRPRIRGKKTPGRRRRGRPKQRWMDCVNGDMMRAIGTTKDEVRDRTGWRRIVWCSDPEGEALRKRINQTSSGVMYDITQEATIEKE